MLICNIRRFRTKVWHSVLHKYRMAYITHSGWTTVRATVNVLGYTIRTKYVAAVSTVMLKHNNRWI